MSSLSHGRILVADDDLPVTALLRALLERQYYEVESVTDGARALARLRTSHFDAMVLDLMLPSVNGFEVIRAVRSFAPELLSRTVVVTAASTETLRDFDHASVAALVRKPFDIDELSSRVAVCAAEGMRMRARAPRERAAIEPGDEERAGPPDRPSRE